MKINIHDTRSQERAAQALAALDLTKRWVVDIREQKSRRSLDQNALYWKWIDAIRLHILDSTGEAYTAEDIAEHMKAKFLPSRVVTIGGESFRCRSTTTKLNTAEMAEYLTLIDRYCANDLGLYLPQPGGYDD